MEQIIERAKAVLSEIIGLKNSLESEKGKVASRGRQQDAVAEVQADKEVELQKREDSVKPIEDIVRFKEAADKVAEESNQGRIALDREKQAFDTFVKSEKAALVEKRRKVNELEATYNRELAALKKAREAVAKDAANIKGKVLGELAKNI